MSISNVASYTLDFLLVSFLFKFLLDAYSLFFLLTRIIPVIINLITTLIYSSGTTKLRHYRNTSSNTYLFSYAQCLLLPLILHELNISKLKDVFDSLFISSVECCWLAHVADISRNIPLLSISVVRLYYFSNDNSAFLYIFTHCAIYLLLNIRQFRLSFGESILVSQLLIVLLHLFIRRRVITSCIEFVYFINIFYRLILLFSVVYLIIYFIYLWHDYIVGSPTVLILSLSLLFYSTFKYLRWFSTSHVFPYDKSSLSFLWDLFLNKGPLRLILFWVLSTICLALLTGYKLRYNTTIITRLRKSFHFLVSINTILAFYFNQELTLVMALLIVISVSVYIELLRVNGLLYPKLAKYLTDLYKMFVKIINANLILRFGEEYVKNELIISHLTLVYGVLLPIIVELVMNETFDWTRAGLGVFTIGIGDSMASIVGSRFSPDKRSIEGSASYFISSFLSMSVVTALQYGLKECADRLLIHLVVSLSTCILEGIVTDNDNIIISLYAVIVYIKTQ